MHGSQSKLEELQDEIEAAQIRLDGARMVALFPGGPTGLPLTAGGNGVFVACDDLWLEVGTSKRVRESVSVRPPYCSMA